MEYCEPNILEKKPPVQKHWSVGSQLKSLSERSNITSSATFAQEPNTGFSPCYESCVNNGPVSLEDFLMIHLGEKWGESMLFSMPI